MANTLRFIPVSLGLDLATPTGGSQLTLCPGSLSYVLFVGSLMVEAKETFIGLNLGEYTDVLLGGL